VSLSILEDSVILATLLGCMLLGGGFYEHLVIDPFWPKRPDLIQQQRGGISRGRFWAPAHTLFELALIVSLFEAWRVPNLRFWLLLAAASHVATRLWSVLDFIPKALAFEKAAAVDEVAATRWTRRSRFRIALELLTTAFLFAALRVAIRG
jgi:hypothetical protein